MWRGRFVRFWGPAVAAALAFSGAPASAAVASVSTESPPPPRADVPCQAVVAGIGPGGDLLSGWTDEDGMGGGQTDIPRADVARRITAMGDVFTAWDDGVPDEQYDMTHTALVVSGGHLQRLVWTRLVTGIDPGTQTGGVTTYSTTVAQDFGRGWGGMTSLHQAPIDWSHPARARYLYGFSTGTLYRYRPVESADGEVVRYRSAGKVAGFSAVRGVALVSSDSKSDQFLMTTKTGSLIRVTVPTTARMTTKATRLRNTGWGGYSRLVPADCRNRSRVVAIDGAGRARLFTFGRPEGLRTQITAAPGRLVMSGWRVYASASQMP